MIDRADTLTGATLRSPGPGGPPSRRPTLRGIPDLLAACIALPAGIYLTATAQGGLAAFSAAVFSLGLLLMLVVSGLYHAVTWAPRQLAWMSRFDHAAIFVLIGASYAPFCLCTGVAGGPWLLAIVWPAALLGALHCLLRPGTHRALNAALYVLLGVAMVPNTPALFRALPGEAFALSVCGGAAYILGAGIYVTRWPNPSPRHFGYHEVFHLFVFAGAACHYAAIRDIVTRA
jgi:hemolysin III